MDSAISSAGEHYIDIVGVTGSIPVSRTILFLFAGCRPPTQPAFDGSAARRKFNPGD